jgi:hypothetical protein
MFVCVCRVDGYATFGQLIQYVYGIGSIATDRSIDRSIEIYPNATAPPPRSTLSIDRLADCPGGMRGAPQQQQEQQHTSIRHTSPVATTIIMIESPPIHLPTYPDWRPHDGAPASVLLLPAVDAMEAGIESDEPHPSCVCGFWALAMWDVCV